MDRCKVGYWIVLLLCILGMKEEMKTILMQNNFFRVWNAHKRHLMWNMAKKYSAFLDIAWLLCEIDSSKNVCWNSVLMRDNFLHNLHQILRNIFIWWVFALRGRSCLTSTIFWIFWLNIIRTMAIKRLRYV